MSCLWSGYKGLSVGFLLLWYSVVVLVHNYSLPENSTFRNLALAVSGPFMA